MQRPTCNDPELLAVAARAILQAMPAGTVAENDEAAAIADIVRALRIEAPAFDEYRLTRQLENCGWDCNREIVDAFEIASGEIHQAVRKATKAWVVANRIKPRLEVGAEAKVMARGSSFVKQQYDGEVVAVDVDHATYTVMVPALGHVREGQGTRGVIVHFEDLHPLAMPVEEFQLEPSC
jgi:hypothetical protein